MVTPEVVRKALRGVKDPELGLNIVTAMFDETTAPKLPRSDVVHLNNMLEHVADPIGLLRLAIGRAWPGGLICVGVPNDYNALQEAARASGAKAWWLAPPHHLNYFDFASLEALLERCGLEIVETLTSFPMELFLLMGDNYVGDEALGNAGFDEALFLPSFDQFLDHVPGRGKIGIAHAEIDDIGTASSRRSLQTVHFREHVGRQALDAVEILDHGTIPRSLGLWRADAIAGLGLRAIL